MGRTSLGEERKEEITLAFYEVAKEVGLDNASIAKVADRMNISKGLVMHYFDTKESLIISLNDYILDRYLVFIQTDKYAIQDAKSLKQFIGSLFTRKWNSYVDDSVFYSFYALIYQNEHIKKNYELFAKKIRFEIQKILEYAVEQEIILNKNIEQTAKILYALVDGVYFQQGALVEDLKTIRQDSDLYTKHACSLLIFSEK